MEIVEIWVRDVPVGANMVCPLVCHSSGTSCHLLYKRRLSQIVSSLEEMPGRAEESARANMIRPLVCHSSGTSCHLLYKRRLSQIVSSLEEMPGRAEESARANTVRPYGGDDTFSTYLSDFTSICAKNSSLRLLLTEHPPPFSREAKDSSALSGISSKRGDIFAKPPLLEVIPHGVGKCHRR